MQNKTFTLHFFRFAEKVSCSFSVLLKKCIRFILFDYDILSCNKFSIVSMIALASSILILFLEAT